MLLKRNMDVKNGTALDESIVDIRDKVEKISVENFKVNNVFLIRIDLF